METGDPDDFLTLALLCGHPEVDLIGVTITPGTPHQVGVVRYLLNRFNVNIPVGVFNINHNKDGKYVRCVSNWHYSIFGNIRPSFDAEEGYVVLNKLFNEDVTLVTGGPLKNVGKMLSNLDNSKLGSIFIQGGFAGVGVVSNDKQLDKFKGMKTCPTYNLNGDSKSALKVIEFESFQERRFISKNVCHGVVYDKMMHQEVLDTIEKYKSDYTTLSMITNVMDSYLRKKPAGKKFHDPLAACCAINPKIGTWANVELYRDKGKWGSRLTEKENSSKIIIDYNRDLFIKTLCGVKDVD